MIASYERESTKHIHLMLQEQESYYKCITKKALFSANCKKSLAETQFPAPVQEFNIGIWQWFKTSDHHDNMKCIITKKVGQCTETGIPTQEVISTSLTPGLSHRSGLDCLQYAKTEGKGHLSCERHHVT